MDSSLSLSLSVSSVGFVASIGCVIIYQRFRYRPYDSYAQTRDTHRAYEQLIGNTPMTKLLKASQLTGCEILVKMENMNPGGTGKDRAAQRMLQDAAERGELQPGGHVVEGTSGSTGIALACLCLAQGYKLHVVMPDDQADEKRSILERLGVEVTVVPCCAISNDNHYVRVARRMAKELNGFYVNQFENTANCQVHEERTGPEILRQCGCPPDAFVMSSGTGGTIAGVSRCLKKASSKTQIVLADPVGSSLFHRVVNGVCYTTHQSERSIRRHRYDSIVEGVGLDRVTANFDRAQIDTAIRVPDQDIIDTAHWLLKQEGLFVGSSSALNVAVACMVAQKLGPGHTIVTVICDHGSRHLSRFWNPQYVSKYNIVWPTDENVVPSYFKSEESK